MTDRLPPPSASVQCADAEDFLLGLEPDRARAIITDLPYCSGAATRGDRKACPTAKYAVSGWDAEDTFEGDSRDERSFTFWAALWMRRALRATARGGVLACFIDWRQYGNLCVAVQAAGWVQRGMLVWDKGRGSRPQPGRPRQQVELVVWASRGPYDSQGLPPFDGCLPYSLRPGDKHHPTGKPIPVMDWLVRGFCKPGQLIVDPFAGSGSTGVSAVRAGCDFRGADQSERWATLAARRIARTCPAEPLQLEIA